MYAFKNTTRNKVWITNCPTGIRKLRSDLKLGRHSCLALQEDWNNGDNFETVEIKNLTFQELHYRPVWQPGREININLFNKYRRQIGDCSVWVGPALFAGERPARISAWLAGAILVAHFPLYNICKTKNCIKAEHLQVLMPPEPLRQEEVSRRQFLVKSRDFGRRFGQ